MTQGKYKDLTGCIFHNWTVLSKAENNKHATYWLCRCSCGREKEVDAGGLNRGTSKSCGHTRRSEENWNWQGGVTKNKAGYMLVKSKGHPRAHPNGSYILEHHLVMEKHLDRYLVKGENIHHLNGIRDDNRIENLELWTKPQPTGIRSEDAIKHAIEVLMRLKPELLK